MLIRVLVCEDEHITRVNFINSFPWLKNKCIVIGEATNGKEGLEIIKNEKPDVVITDIQMPIMTGLEMIKEGQKYHTFYPVIISSYTEFAYAKQAIEMDVEAYVLKPLDFEEISEVLLSIYAKMNKQIEYINLQKYSESKSSDIYQYIKNKEGISSVVSYALQAIEDRYQYRISIVELANELGISESSLRERFSKETSCRFLDVLNQYRLHQAFSILISDATVDFDEVVVDCGFYDYKHFYNVCKKMTNLSPKQFLLGMEKSMK